MCLYVFIFVDVFILIVFYLEYLWKFSLWFIIFWNCLNVIIDLIEFKIGNVEMEKRNVWYIK